ncbi:MAG: DUF3581 domain-containing protein [Methylococcales symbiont of Hymedesmia sp. n. MRB-2018]|nr:MAG: DUF3581 domain-containing protein [Methylococcales symbiont of Hymedesmia sp. n. MRB-2018]
MLKEYYSGSDNCTAITAEQGSLFAKEVAGDFNPLHDVDAKRFCVPGDLLFAIALEKYGLSKTMNFKFTGMLGHNITLDFPVTEDDHFDINGSNNKTIMKVARDGDKITDDVMIDALIRDYVEFSGHNFPYVLVPLMKQQNGMINLTRPLVMYDSMCLEFNHLNFTHPKVEMLEPELSINGKRGDAYLHFQIKSDDEVVGKGYKKIVISGIREYEEGSMQDFVDNYLARKDAYLEAVRM